MLGFFLQKSDCCSHTAISFHYVWDFQYEFLEFFLYYANVFGVHREQRALPSRLSFKEMNERLQFWAKQVTDNKN